MEISEEFIKRMVGDETVQYPKDRAPLYIGSYIPSMAVGLMAREIEELVQSKTYNLSDYKHRYIKDCVEDLVDYMFKVMCYELGIKPISFRFGEKIQVSNFVVTYPYEVIELSLDKEKPILPNFIFAFHLQLSFLHDLRYGDENKSLNDFVYLMYQRLCDLYHRYENGTRNEL